MFSPAVRLSFASVISIRTNIYYILSLISSPDREQSCRPDIRRKTMRTVSIFKNGTNRAILLPRDLDFEGVSELEIVREGDSIILRPVRPTWAAKYRAVAPFRVLSSH